MIRSELSQFGFGFLAFHLLPIAFLSPVPEAAAYPLDTRPAYYGEEFYQRALGRLRNEELVDELRRILTSKHSRRSGDSYDTVGRHCDDAQKGCYEHSSIGYKTARRMILGRLHVDESKNAFTIKEVYCDRDFTSDDWGRRARDGERGGLPSDKIINVEHTWPQSRFNKSLSKDTQKCDLHHLFPTDSKMNQIRGNMKFGEVDRPAFDLPCSASQMGSIDGYSGDYFEPPADHKGNVARALFYFSVRYSLPIDSEEERFLKDWNKLDPVDAEEIERNERIQEIQGNRNPFIDFPELAEDVANF